VVNINRVFVTGIGLISALGLSNQENWENLTKGRSGVKKITLFDSNLTKTKIAAEVSKGLDELIVNAIPKRSARQMTRVTKMGLLATKMAIDDSLISWDQHEKERCGVILGIVSTSGIVNKSFSSLETDPKFQIIKRMNNALPAWISIKYGLKGPSFSVCSGCASSAHAIATGFDLVRSGMADVMVVGGADSSINPEDIRGFNDLLALSERYEFPETVSSPFDQNRDGFVMGEGAGILILESENSAIRRKANIYAELLGYGTTSEAFNIMQPEKGGEGMARTMSLALRNCDLQPGQVGYINAHGTSTSYNDYYETLAIKKIFGQHAYNLKVSSTKSMLGHTLGAAGAVEAIVSVKSMFHQLVTPTINYHNPDPKCDLDYVPNESIPHDFDIALSNSFAFGGHNVSLVFKKANTNQS